MSVTVEPRDQLERATARMVDALAHRGPDGRGQMAWAAPEGSGPSVTLGHTRLAIIDLTDAAAQPMRSPRRPVWLSYNGEIYNFAEVRRDLEADGCRFSTASDTEVILQGYERWGRDVVRRLRGMFAFAIWDADRRELVLARDRFGIKPLYVHRSASRVVFGSEVRAILASGLVDARLDRDALDLYLRYQTVPAPRTLVRDLTMVEPGSVVTITEDGRVSSETYWDLLTAAADAKHATGAGRDTHEAVRAMLREAVDLHMVSDVPVGLFLSGGIDSSAIASLVKATGRRPQTFAVTLGGTSLDEAEHARAVARALDAEHTEIPIGEPEMLRELPAALSAVDHPSGDGINTYIVSRAVRQTGLKVALSGLGGDEIFGGYPSFRRLSRLPAFAGLWRLTPAPVRRAAAAAVRSVGAGVSAAKTAAILESDASLPAVYPVLREVFSRDDRRALLGAGAGGAVDPYTALLTEASARTRDLDVSALVSFAEARTYMHDVLLRDTDQMSMRHALEVRVPLLDHRLAELVVGLPASTKLVAGRQKPVLVEALEPRLPESVVHRPKQGFVLPFDVWMRGPLREFCEARLGADGLAGRGLVDPKAVDRLWSAFAAGDGTTTWARPWTLVALDAWLDQSGVAL